MFQNGYQIRQAAISGGNGPRASLFAPATKEVFGLGSSVGFDPVLAAIALGQTTAQDYYAKAKSEITRWDALVGRVAKLANKADRDRIIDYYGLSEPGNKDKDAYTRAAVASDVANAEKYSPVAYEEGFPTHGPSRRRVEDLGDYIKDLDKDVTYSEQTYGSLPAPVVIERVVTGPGAVSASSPWPYVIVGGGVVAALAIAGVI